MTTRYFQIVEILRKMGDNCHKKGWWTKYSESKLVEIENKILGVVKTAFKTWFVPIGSTIGNDDRIWTIALNENASKTPLVLLHGFAAGIGFWCMNFDEIAKDRPVYAIDLIGFGRSSRPVFARDCETAEQQWVSAIEAWRKQLNIENFILLGHSFGGYLATSYTINYPERVKHLILADPWGFAERSANFKPPTWVKVMGVVLYPLTYFNPLATVRAIGPFGPWLVKKMRTDISRKYEEVFDDKETITEYIYHCNSQYPSGESAFHSFLKGFGWNKNPMIKRFDKLHDHIPITIVYGAESWIAKEPGITLQNQKKYVNIEVIPSAGHHLYSDQPKIFNEIVRKTCSIVDNPNRLDIYEMNASKKLLRLYLATQDDQTLSEEIEEEVLDYTEDKTKHVSSQ